MDPKHTRLRQLDRQLSAIAAPEWKPPRRGWVRAIREALGVSGEQLATRMGLADRSAISRLEASEQRDAVSLSTLRRAADAMDCELVYALVPRGGSLDGVLQRRARAVAEQVVAHAALHMALEDQSTSPTAQQDAVEDLAAELVRARDARLWRD